MSPATRHSRQDSPAWSISGQIVLPIKMISWKHNRYITYLQDIRWRSLIIWPRTPRTAAPPPRPGATRRPFQNSIPTTCTPRSSHPGPSSTQHPPPPRLHLHSRQRIYFLEFATPGIEGKNRVKREGKERRKEKENREEEIKERTFSPPPKKGESTGLPVKTWPCFIVPWNNWLVQCSRVQ